MTCSPGYARGMSRFRRISRAWLVVGLVPAVAAAALALGALHLPDWTNPKQSDYDQAAALIAAGIVLAAAGYAWFAWRMRRPR